MSFPMIAITKQEFPETPRPYRLIETYLTSEGPRTRVCSGAFSTFDDAKNWRADLIAEMPRPIVASQQCGGPIEAIRKVRDGYADQARFADVEQASYFREFVRRIDAALS